MNKAFELLRRSASKVEANRKDRKQKGDRNGRGRHPRSPRTTSSPLKSTHQHINRDSGSSRGEKKWRQKLAESKILKRLMQPVYSDDDTGDNCHTRDDMVSNGDAHRLGEIPARSKYLLPDQKSHFANHPTYLPLAEQCRPLQPSSLTSLTPRQGCHQKPGQSSGDNNDGEVGGHTYGAMGEEVGVDDDNYAEAQQTHQERHHGIGHVGSLYEGAVKSIQGNPHRILTASIGSSVSGASSVGPTGLALMPQFRWVPKQGGGGLGFNPFMNFRYQPQQECIASMLPTPWMNTPTPLSDAQQPDDETPELLHGVASPEHEQQQNEGQLHVSGRHNSYSMFYALPSPPPAPQSVPSTRPHCETGTLSFYGPIGSIGIEASCKRRAVEQQSGTDGAAEKAYKERSSRRPAEREETSIQLLTQLWCDVNLLRDARIVDSPGLSCNDDENDDSASGTSSSTSNIESNNDNREFDEAAMAAREKVRQRRQQYSARSPSFYFKDGDLAALRVEDNAEDSTLAPAPRATAVHKPVAVSAQHQQRSVPSTVKATSPAALTGGRRAVGGVAKTSVRRLAAHEVASSSSSSGSSDNDSGGDDSNSDECNTGERSSGFGSDDDNESVDSGDAVSPHRNDNDAHGNLTHLHSWKKRSSIHASTGMSRSVLEYGQYDFMNSFTMNESFVSHMPDGGGGARINLLYVPDDYNDGGEAAAVGDLVLNYTPRHVSTKSAETSVKMKPHPPLSPSIPSQSQERHGSPSMSVARGSAVGPSGNGAAVTPRRGQRRVNNATDIRSATVQNTSHHGGSTSSSSHHHDGGGCGLGEQLAYGSSFGLGSRHNSYLATPCDEAHDAASVSLSVYGVVSGNPNTISSGTSMMDGDGEAFITRGVYRDSRDQTVTPATFGVVSRGPAAPLTVGCGSAVKTCNAASQQLTLPLIDRGSVSPATYSRPPSAAQRLRVPVTPTSPQRLARGTKTVYPGGYLPPITPPVTPTAKKTPAQRNKNAVSTSSFRDLANASITPGLGDIVGGKSYTSLAYELPGT
ncbi:hypothetical protein LPMP_205220 [Leishmania panamensis]|uniref:Uncharacterized protein n=1 Tax=Leishmania panamensis TaxID=5679 RepID=A0A088RRZ7_LEIPA|nr:hypothetical protein LPMP_205220 [Leishmania panamensis]AIN98014.1 hypothetical protein LPMP_205220 [Leishmania panamensis]